MNEEELNFQIFVQSCFGQQGIGQFTMQGAPCDSGENDGPDNENDGPDNENQTPTPEPEPTPGPEEEPDNFEDENPRDENNEELVEQWADDYTCPDKEPSAETTSWLTTIGAITPIPYEGDSWPDCCVKYLWEKQYITPVPTNTITGTPKKYAQDPITGQQYQWVSSEEVSYDDTLQCFLRDEKNVFRLDESGDYILNRQSHLFSSYKGMCDGEYEVEVPDEMPIGFLANNSDRFDVQNTPVPVTPTVTVPGITEYYSGNFKINITGNFGRAYYASAAHGYKNTLSIKGGEGTDGLGAIKYNCQTCGEPTPTP